MGVMETVNGCIVERMELLVGCVVYGTLVCLKEKNFGAKEVCWVYPGCGRDVR